MAAMMPLEIKSDIPIEYVKIIVSSLLTILGGVGFLIWRAATLVGEFRQAQKDIDGIALFVKTKRALARKGEHVD